MNISVLLQSEVTLSKPIHRVYISLCKLATHLNVSADRQLWFYSVDYTRHVYNSKQTQSCFERCMVPLIYFFSFVFYSSFVLLPSNYDHKLEQKLMTKAVSLNHVPSSIWFFFSYFMYKVYETPYQTVSLCGHIGGHSCLWRQCLLSKRRQRQMSWGAAPMAGEHYIMLQNQCVSTLRDRPCVPHEWLGSEGNGRLSLGCPVWRRRTFGSNDSGQAEQHEHLQRKHRMLPVVQGNVNAHKIAVDAHSTLHMCTQPIRSASWYRMQ